jgi:hypothetical protein
VTGTEHPEGARARASFASAPLRRAPRGHAAGDRDGVRERSRQRCERSAALSGVTGSELGERCGDKPAAAAGSSRAVWRPSAATRREPPWSPAACGGAEHGKLIFFRLIAPLLIN